jgi:hypothetical protein
MRTSSPRPEVDDGRGGRGPSHGGPRPAVHVAGRLVPLALDRAAQELDPMLLSVTLGGLDRRQIAALCPLSSRLAIGLRAAIRAILASGR